MQTLKMHKGDIFIGEDGQPVQIRGKEKLVQDIGEALNSGFNAIKKFGGRLYNLGVSSKSDVVSEVYIILERLMNTQTNADLDEKIKSINAVKALTVKSSLYVYINVSSYKEDDLGATYNIL